MCFSWGFDVPQWHTSNICPHEYRKQGHQEEFIRNNVEQYIAEGQVVCHKGRSKRYLPIEQQPGFK